MQQAVRLLLLRPLPLTFRVCPPCCDRGTTSRLFYSERKNLLKSSYHNVFLSNGTWRRSMQSSSAAHLSGKKSGAGIFFGLTFGSLGGLLLNKGHVWPKAVASLECDKQEKIFVAFPKENEIEPKSDSSPFLWWVRRLWVPSLLVMTVVMGWEYPLSLIVNLVFLLLSTKPTPSSFYLWAEQRRMQQSCQKQGLDRIKAQLNPASLMHVEIHDYLLLCVATATSFSQKLTVVGILGEWWIIYTSSSSFTGFGLSSLHEYLSK
ncbi:hypothetical protein O6H91_08G040300 [Diphasiastrum complanatum]|uniref:Uncharacterized protein n=1 Tax=Diphasiastrum complanatum TaxID=34168 RepID=A0ACC2CWS5_DIPCM|nr:hypothetical protein O6H91_08G040300 [Diphasiastrum complanatum]